MTEAVIRRAGDADLAAIARLRRDWTREQGGGRGDPDFDQRLAAWFAREQASCDLAACAATVRGSRAASSPSGRAALSFRLAPKQLDRTCMAGAAFCHPSWAGPGPSRYQMAG
jgi:hypothetical protein